MAWHDHDNIMMHMEEDVKVERNFESERSLRKIYRTLMTDCLFPWIEFKASL
jgi:hypothetical protein